MAPQREWFEKDYYAVLGVASDASDKDITRAYRKLAKRYHPDANPGDAEAEERFKEAAAANEVLGDPDKRKEYDQVREMVASGGGGGGFRDFPGGFQGQTINLDDLGGFGDVLGNLFGGGAGGFRGSPGGFQGQTINLDDLGGFGDVLGNLFGGAAGGGRGRGRGRGRPGRRGPPRGCSGSHRHRGSPRSHRRSRPGRRDRRRTRPSHGPGRTPCASRCRRARRWPPRSP